MILEDFDPARLAVRDYLAADDWWTGEEIILPTKGLIAPAVLRASKTRGVMVTLDGFDLPHPEVGCSEIHFPIRVGFFEDVEKNRPQSAAAAAAARNKTLEEMVSRFYGLLNPVNVHALGLDPLIVGDGRYITREKFRTFEVRTTLHSSVEFDEAVVPSAQPVPLVVERPASIEANRVMVRRHFDHDDFFAGLALLCPTDGMIKDAVEQAQAPLGVAIGLEGVDVNDDAPGEAALGFSLKLRFWEDVSLNRPQSPDALARTQTKTLEQLVMRTLALFHPVRAMRHGGTPALITKGRFVEALENKLTFDVDATVKGGWLTAAQ